MIVLGIDPGLKPGYGWRSSAFPSVWRHVRYAPGLVPDVVVTEGVWFAPKGAKGKGTPKTIAQLSFTCGRQVQRYAPAAVYRLPVQVWKDAVIYRGAHLPKEIFVQRVRKLLGLGEDATADEVEACGLVFAFEKLGGPERCAEWLEKEPP